MASMQPVSATGANSASHPYTCNTCQVAYRNIDLQKGHMKSDWHRYNLKRRVASLPPISADVFTDKVLQARAVSTAEADKAYFERACDVCNKTYYSENAYQNHLSSQKHRVNEGSAPAPTDETTSVISSTFSLGEPTSVPRRRLDSDVEDDIKDIAKNTQQSESTHAAPANAQPSSNPEADTTSIARESDSATPVQSAAEPTWSPHSCIFCNYESPSVPLNITHMERIHGMFIPEKNYVADLDGLVDYLQRKVREHHQCLFCGKFKSGIFAVQTHMRDTGHCKIPYTTEEEQLEIGDFYDFRSTYSDGAASDDDDDDDESGEGEQGGAKLGRKSGRDAKGDGDDESGAEDDGWETDSSASSLDSADLTAVPAEGHLHQFERLSKHPHHSRRDPRNRHQVDGWHSHAHKHTHAVFYDEYELHLPSGKSVGHRSLNKYYRQNLVNYPTAEEQAERKAIEGARESDDENGDQALIRRGGRRGRELVPRGVAGLAGVSEQKKQNVRRAEQHGRSLETVTAKQKDWAYGKKLNNYKGYYYRYQGGG